MTIANKVLELDEQLEIISEKVIDQADLIDLVKSALDGLPDKNGIDTSNATATNEDLVQGKTAYANGVKLVGIAKTYDEGYHKGHSDGYQEALDSGQDDVYNNGYNDGYNIGRDDGIAITNDATALAEHILDGETAYIKGEKIEGIMPNNGAVSQALDIENDSYIIPEGYHNGMGTVSIEMTNNGSVSQVLDKNTTKFTIPEGYHDGTGEISIVTDYRVVSAKPQQQVIQPEDGKVLTSVIITSQGNATEGNIKPGVTICGVTGTFTNDATATAEDVAIGKTAYAKGQKLVGTRDDFSFLIGTTWIFNENIDVEENTTLYFTFKSNNQTFNAMSMYKLASAPLVFSQIKYGSTTVFSNDPMSSLWNNSTSIDYRIFTITGTNAVMGTNFKTVFNTLTKYARMVQPIKADSITSVANKSWFIGKRGFGVPAGLTYYHNINFFSNGKYFNKIEMSYALAPDGESSDEVTTTYYEASSGTRYIVFSNVRDVPWSNINYRTINIIDGDDVTNTGLKQSLSNDAYLL